MKVKFRPELSPKSLYRKRLSVEPVSNGIDGIVDLEDHEKLNKLN